MGEEQFNKLLKSMQGEDLCKNREGRGRKKKTGSREDRKIMRMSLKYMRKCSNDIVKDLKGKIGVELSSRTLRRRLLDSGLKSCRAKKKQLLSEKASSDPNNSVE